VGVDVDVDVDVGGMELVEWRRRRRIGGKICRTIDTMRGTAEVADVG
jgi:hypothetical protein